MANTITTTNIGIKERNALKKLSSHHALRQIEFINAAIDYFKKTGINPAEEIFSPREEIAKLTKRVDQVVQFIRKNEQSKLNPLLDSLIIISKKIEEQLSEQITINQFNELLVNFNNFFSTIGNNIKNIESQQNVINKSTNTISNTLLDLNSEIKILKKMLVVMYRSHENKHAMSSGFKSEHIQEFNYLISD
ncbi:BfmA/BtgA family mobilization protein [Plebeiibacterium sediminum]|uniref:BfmA/BtgA family mobilization protein n=1 Tax=Plebeiibacterium sediminum TaxID=2992112 RepID=A0AAE3M972_9BACT|nr:BfmA/BtgA family mobilization protein [Plebeiobacterium sediminum]MCW3788905.1 BfmA/BtgA family mobilization protein [Plebeiobacterium sediminum]